MKIPKSLPACADLLAKVREERLAADKVAAGLKEQEQEIINHIIDNLPKDSSGAMGKTHCARIVIKAKPQVKDWDKFWAYVHKHKAYDLVQRRIGEAAINERLADKRVIPGIEIFNAVTVSLTKVK